MRREHDLQSALAPVFPLVPTHARPLRRRVGDRLRVLRHGAHRRGPSSARTSLPDLGLGRRRGSAPGCASNAVDVLGRAARGGPRGLGAGLRARPRRGLRPSVRRKWLGRHASAAPSTPDVGDPRGDDGVARGAPADGPHAHPHWCTTTSASTTSSSTPQDPTRVVGVLDWELATVGDPLMDLGWGDGLLGRRPTTTRRPSRIRLQPTHAPGMLTRAEVVERYTREPGAVDVSARAPGASTRCSALFRLAGIAQQIYYRFHEGQTSNPAYGGFRRPSVAPPRPAMRPPSSAERG